VGNLPGITSAISPTLSPGGNAGGLFPTLQPSSGSSATKDVKARPVSDSTALPEGASVLGASLIGLIALALAFVLAVTRFSIRRRPAPTTPGSAAAAAPSPSQDAAAAAAAGTTEAPATQAADKAPSTDTPEPPKDAPVAAEDATGTPSAAADAPEAAEAPADPQADGNPAKDA
jgi:predicted lipid-binding transport protein (Tim44 family)